MIITIESGIPLPPGRRNALSRYGTLRRAIEITMPGQSFMIENRTDQLHCYRIADELGYRIKTQKQAKGGWRVWKLSPSDIPPTTRIDLL
jgi:hypothetical protein